MSTTSIQDDSSHEEEPELSLQGQTNIHLLPQAFDYTQFLAHILRLHQSLAGQPHGVLESLCREIRNASHRQVQLILLRKQGKLARVPKSWHRFDVEANGRSYGKLYFAPNPSRPADPIVPYSIAAYTASFCASLLFSLEMIALSNSIYQLSTSDTSPTFTPREKEVLELICRGYDLQTIASIFQTSLSTVRKQRDRVYAKFGVQNEQEAVFAAFSSGLYSPLEDLMPHIEHPLPKT